MTLLKAARGGGRAGENDHGRKSGGRRERGGEEGGECNKERGSGGSEGRQMLRQHGPDGAHHRTALVEQIAEELNQGSETKHAMHDYIVRRECAIRERG